MQEAVGVLRPPEGFSLGMNQPRPDRRTILPSRETARQPSRLSQNLRRFAAALRKNIPEVTNENQQVAETAPVETSTQPPEITLEEVSKRFNQAVEMLQDPSRIISQDTRIRIAEAQEFLKHTGKQLENLTADERSALSIYLDVAASSFGGDINLTKAQQGISAAEVSLVGARAKLGEMASTQVVVGCPHYDMNIFCRKMV